jgi:hypothetical protein
LPTQRFLAEMARRQVGERIKQQIEGSKEFKVASTPAVFLDGRRVHMWDSMAFWQAVLSRPTSRPASGSQPSHSVRPKPKAAPS